MNFPKVKLNVNLRWTLTLALSLGNIWYWTNLVVFQKTLRSLRLRGKFFPQRRRERKENENFISKHHRLSTTTNIFNHPILLLRKDGVLYNHYEVKFMPIKKIKTSSNGSLPTAKDFPPPKKLTPAQKRLRDATRDFVKALDERIKKYGEPPDFRH